MMNHNGNGHNNGKLPPDDDLPPEDPQPEDEQPEDEQPEDEQPEDEQPDDNDASSVFDEFDRAWFGDWSEAVEDTDDDEELDEPEPQSDGLGGDDDGGKFGNFGDALGLPEFWDPSEIPNWDELEEAARKKLLRFAALLRNTEKSISQKQRQEIYEVFQQYVFMPEMLPALYSFATNFRDALQGVLSEDRWRSIWLSLLLAIEQHQYIHPETQNWLSHIWRELAQNDSVFKNYDELETILHRMTQYARASEDSEELVLTYATLLRMGGGRLQIDEIKDKAQKLLKLAGDNQYQRMHIYIAAGFACHQKNNLWLAFVYGQQALVIAHHLGNTRQAVVCISLMTTMPLVQNQSVAYIKKLYSYWNRLPRQLQNNRFWAFYFYGQVVPYLCCVNPNHELGVRLCDRALRLIGDRVVQGRAEILHSYGISLTYLGRHDEAKGRFKEAREIYGHYRRREYQVAMSHAMAWVELERGNCEEALVDLEKAKAEAKDLGESDVKNRLLKAIEADIEKCKKKGLDK